MTSFLKMASELNKIKIMTGMIKLIKVCEGLGAGAPLKYLVFKITLNLILI